MENKEQLRSLLISYFAGETSPEQDLFVAEWVKADEQNRLYFEELRNTWRLTSLKKTVDNTDIDQEWERFSQVIAARKARLVPAEEQQAMDSGLLRELPLRKSPVYKIALTAAIAASVLVAVGLGLNWFGREKPQQPPIAQAQSTEKIAPAPILRHETNNSGTNKKIVLPDGSEIMLAHNSELTYESPFGNARNITLKGKASFKVAGDKARPFTVFSDDISTTALGTQFTVDNFEENENITVVLYEGSVVVKPAGDKSRALRDYILSPGYQLVYNRQKITARMSRLKERMTVARGNAAGSPAYDDPTMPQNTSGSWYMFNNQPLQEVFDQLQAMYSVEIEYSRKDIANMYFIGRFEKTDSLEKMLEKIALANSLKMTKAGKKYIMHK